jgi:diguanylate cyclase (GGDEF)-like protein
MKDNSSSQKIKVLVVDDSRVVRIAASKMFNDEFEIFLAVDGKEAWELLNEKEDIQVIFTDLMMPVMDGYELLKTIRTSDNDKISNLPVIVATGADNPEVAKQKAISLGATDFITKPFDATDITARALSYANFHKSTQRLKEHTTIDVLTGLMNGKGIHTQLAKEIAFVNRHKSTMTTMTIQVDNFKELFVRVGRNASDTIIKKISEVILRAVRKEDTAARTGVATFLVTMPLAVAPNTMELADQICNAVERFRAKLGKQKLDITVSIGVCAFDHSNQADHRTVLLVGDKALQKAQDLGRSQIYKMTINEYRGIQAKQAKGGISIDELIGKIHKGNTGLVVPYLDGAVEELIPLFSLLSPEQKQRLLVGAIQSRSKTSGITKLEFT